MLSSSQQSRITFSLNSNSSKSQMSFVDGLLMSSTVKEKANNLVSPIPEYVESIEYKIFCEKYKPNISENVGYMLVILDKETYRPGQTIEGRIFFELFIPSFQNRLMIKLEGRETFPQKLYDTVFNEVIVDNTLIPKPSTHKKVQSIKIYADDLPGLETSRNLVRKSNHHRDSGWDQSHEIQYSKSQKAKKRTSVPFIEVQALNDQSNWAQDQGGSGEAEIEKKPHPELIKKTFSQDVIQEEDAQKEEDNSDSGESNADKQEELNQETPTCSLYTLQIQKPVYTFDKYVPIGQYEFPFTIRLPNIMSNSCKLRLANDELYQISYTIKAFFDSSEPILSFTKPFIVNKVNKLRMKKVSISIKPQIDNEEQWNVGNQNDTLYMLEREDENEFKNQSQDDTKWNIPLGKNGSVELSNMFDNSIDPLRQLSNFEKSPTFAKGFSYSSKQGGVKMAPQIEDQEINPLQNLNSRSIELKTKCCICPIFEQRIQETIIVQLLDYRSRVDPNTDQLKVKLHLGQLSKFTKQVQIQLYHEMQVKKVSLSIDKSKWEVIETTKNLIYKTNHLTNINAESLFTINFQTLIDSLAKQEEIMSQHIVSKSVQKAFYQDSSMFNKDISSSRGNNLSGKEFELDQKDLKRGSLLFKSKVQNTDVKPVSNIHQLQLLSSNGNLLMSKFSLMVTVCLRSDIKQEFELPLEFSSKGDGYSSTANLIDKQCDELQTFKFFEPFLMPGSHFKSTV